MTVTLQQLNELLSDRENEHLECKEAKNNFHFEKLVRYCCALANERGGIILLGVTDRVPRRVVGSQVFPDLERTKAGLVERLHLRVDAAEINHPDGRVLTFEVPSRPIGTPIQCEGAYWMRAGEDLVAMTPDLLGRIFSEAGPDFSAEFCPEATFFDLDPQAIETFRRMWEKRSGNEFLAHVNQEQLLGDAELMVDGRITYAALVLLGSGHGVGRHLPNAEVIFEYRNSEASIPYQQRKEYREGFLLFHDELWNTISLRNELHHYQDGLFVYDIPTFNELVVREAMLNAICHRDYRHGGSIFIRQFPQKLEIESPGAFPPGITVDNILWRQYPRNRRIAETLTKCGLVERSGQGMNRIVEQSIRESKPRPDFTGTDEYQVMLTLRGEVQDPSFVRFLEKVGRETLSSFDTHDLLLLDFVHRDQSVPEELRGRIPRLRDLGVVEVLGWGRGTRYMLSKRFYTFVGQGATYTRRRGLDRETNKELLLRHIRANARSGSRLEELTQVLPAQSRRTVQRLLSELKAEGRLHTSGRTSAARWYAGSGKNGSVPRGEIEVGE